MIGHLVKHKQTVLYGLALAVLLFLLKWLELKFIIVHYSFEWYTGAIALLFTALGIWLAISVMQPTVQTVIVEKEVYIKDLGFSQNVKKTDNCNLSKRELEVLQLMADGLSNQEIAGRLFVSLNTIKTHSSKIFEKMEVKRRTQAVEMGKRLQMIP